LSLSLLALDCTFGASKRMLARETAFGEREEKRLRRSPSPKAVSRRDIRCTAFGEEGASLRRRRGDASKRCKRFSSLRTKSHAPKALLFRRRRSLVQASAFISCVNEGDTRASLRVHLRCKPSPKARRRDSAQASVAESNTCVTKGDTSAERLGARDAQL